MAKWTVMQLQRAKKSGRSLPVSRVKLICYEKECELVTCLEKTENEESLARGRWSTAAVTSGLRTNISPALLIALLCVS